MSGSKKCGFGCACGHHKSYERTSTHRQMMSDAAKEFWQREEYQERQSESQRGKPHTQDPIRYAAQNAAHSERMKAKFRDDPDYAQAVSKTWKESPNKLEQLMIAQLSPLGWEFVGDGQVWIVGKNPDFIHRESHRLLEIFGDYWHREDDSQERIDHFAEYGWPCTVIWESEIKKDLDLVVDQLRV